MHLEELVKALKSKGVRVQAVCCTSQANNNGNCNSLLNALASLGVETQLQDSIPSKYFIIDNKSVSLIINEPEEETCIQIQSVALCNILRESFTKAREKARTTNCNHDDNNKLNSNQQNKKLYSNGKSLTVQKTSFLNPLQFKPAERFRKGF